MSMLNSIVEIWQTQVGLCKKAKWEQFGKTAQRAWDYLGKSYKHLHLDDEQFRVPIEPQFKTRRNLSREYVALMLPMLHHQVPVRQVSPRRPPVPDALLKLMAADESQDISARQASMGVQEQLLAFLMQWWLNYLPGLYGLSREARIALPEALVKGRAVVWHEMTESPHGMVPASFFGSVDDLFCDVDSKQWRDCGYIIRRRHSSLRAVAKRFGRPLKELRSKYHSNIDSTKNDTVSGGGDVVDAGTEKDRDGCVYYEVWSRIGVGQTLPGVSEEMQAFATQLDGLGQHVWLAYMPGVPYPLNLPPEVYDEPGAMEEVRRRLRWPVESYRDPENPWPCSVLDFYPNASDPWASSPLEGSLPLLAFLDHIYSYLLGRVARSACDLIITSSELAEVIRTAIEKGKDLEIVTADGKVGEDMSKLIEVVQFPEMQKDVWQVISLVERAFERASGMLPEAYGAQPATQDRSAAATQARESHLTSRPQDFANTVEAWHSQIAAKEALMSRLYVTAKQVAPLFGETMRIEEDGSQWPDGYLSLKWMELVNTDDPAIAASEMLYTVEAGSGQRKNKRKLADDAIQIVQTLMPIAQSLIERGNVDPYNQMIEFLEETFGRSLKGMKIAPMQPTIRPVSNEPEPDTTTAKPKQGTKK